MINKICIVTGANSGIGKAVTNALAEAGATIAMICRDQEKGALALQEIQDKTKNTNLELFLADLSSQKEIRSLAQKLKERYPNIDILINNAGAINPHRVLTVDGIENTFAVNHLAYFLLTHLLLDRLKASRSPRVINVASEAQRTGKFFFDDLGLERNYTPGRAYSQSKLANVVFTYELARKLADTNIVVNAVHPGLVRTNFGADLSGFFGFIIRVLTPFMRSPEKGAETVVWLATASEEERVTGKYFSDKKPIQSSKISYNMNIARQLWQVSEKLTGLQSFAGLS